MRSRRQKQHKEMISTVDLTYTGIVVRPNVFAGRLRQAWLACQCAVLGHDAPPREPGQWLRCSRCGKLVGGS